MTTIAYHHKDKTISVDGRTTSGNDICTDKAIKTIKRDGYTFFLAGTVPDKGLFVDHALSGRKLEESIDVIGFAVKGGSSWLISIDEGSVKWTTCEYSEAVGSGYKWAIAAMDFGCGSKDAVRYAAKRDVYTGGRISTYKVDDL